MKKPDLLFLCHRIPFPPNKGDKIRSFHFLKELHKHFNIHLCFFIDDPDDRIYVKYLNKYCQSMFYRNQSKLLSKIKGTTAFLTNQPITLPYYYNRQMQIWVDNTIKEHNIDNVFIFSSAMAQYVNGKPYQNKQRVIDFVDVDSDKWRQYAENKSGLGRKVYQREYQLLQQFERNVCQQFNHSLFVSEDEAQLFKEDVCGSNKPELQQKVHAVFNGVDVDFFSPVIKSQELQPLINSPSICFTGAMDYWANIDAVLWFVNNVWPDILVKCPDATFYIVGGNPSKQVIKLGKQPRVIVTGRVPDVRPYIQQASCVVAPLRIARGIQNKVLEAMSMDKPIVVTSMAMEGINAPSSSSIFISDGPEDYIKYCLQFLPSDQAKQESCINHHGEGNRQWILQNFTWQQTLHNLFNFFNSPSISKLKG